MNMFAFSSNMSVLSDGQKVVVSSVQDVTIHEDKEASAVGACMGKGKLEGKGEIDKDEEEEDEEGVVGVGKKDPLLRRFQLLVTSGLAKELADVCRVHAGELLHSQWGTDVIFEVIVYLLFQLPVTCLL
jgi:hypothetical protein